MSAGLSKLSIDPQALWHSAVDWVSNHSSQIGMAALMGAIIVGLLYGLKLIGFWLCRPNRSNAAWANHWPALIGKTLSRTRFWFMLAVAAQCVSSLAQAPETIAWLVRLGFVAAFGIQAAIWARTFILGLVQHRASVTDPTGSLDSAIGIIRLLVTVTLFLLAAIVILSNMGVNVSGLLAGLGIGGIAIGLAAQGIFSDLFAALSILFDKPFRKGDLVRWDTSAGHVEYIGLKSTRIRALSGEEIIISNANLLSKELRNFERLERRRISQPLALLVQTPLAKATTLSVILEPAINACEGCIFVRVGLETFGASSLDFMLVYDIIANDQNDILARRNAVNLAVLQVFEDANISFAYPTQTTYTAAPDGTLVMPWAPPTLAPAPPKAKRKT